MNKKMISNLSKISCSLLTSVLTLLLTANVAEASRINGTGVNFRPEANQTCEPYKDSALSNEDINLLDFDGDYLKITKNDKIGYIKYNPEYVYIEETPNATVLDGPTRIRKTASLADNSNVCDGIRLFANDRVYVLTQKGEFYVIEYNHQLYYVHTTLIVLDVNKQTYQTEVSEEVIEQAIKNKDNVEENQKELLEKENKLEAEEAINENVTEEKIETNIEKQNNSLENNFVYVTTADVLNVRQGASTSFATIGKLYGGTQVSILETVNEWYKVEAKGLTGYICSDYVTKVISGDKYVSDSLQLLGISYNGLYNGINIDCSGLTYYVYKILNGINIPRSSRDQANVNNYKNAYQVSFENLQPGDLVFFYSGCSHVGMYIGNGEFIQAENWGIEVRVTKFYGDSRDYNHWGNNFVKAIRIVE